MDAESADHLIRFRDRGYLDQPVESVATDRITAGFSPRTGGEDGEYAKTLAEAEGELPPILVHRPTMRVIDGAHRLRAAALRGETHIRVRYFDGERSEAELLAVAANVTHGRPLTAADRTAAAGRVFASHPRWSDRAVAAVTGLSARKISQLRKGTAAAETGHRVGRDGRARPVDPSRARELAGELLRSNPGASLRRIAAEAGLSPATVADVRDRIRRGEDPVPARRGDTAPADRRRAASPSSASPSSASPSSSSPSASSPAADPISLAARRGSAPRRPVADPQPAPDRLLRIFESLRRDPSLRLSESGRDVLRMLGACALVAQDREKIAASLPRHCKEPMAQLVQGYAGLWRLLADELACAEAAEAS
ncbi:ParB N-terminal domain-containing protein [Streptomyces sp. ISL-43]|uniref:ParB/RepB/Spo0J family partition protein n=1 Tax=Streptomyces sp. ISL-43 TaxID=2819183 RepID=UPI001BEB169C|nr:ParB N-terminal domain-containing protein [Streptomyces sp. ISL-43]MBT2447960.1 ParB N-terminal domain-containing protein [Streptomyces sp. ISL-43]